MSNEQDKCNSNTPHINDILCPKCGAVMTYGGDVSYDCPLCDAEPRPLAAIEEVICSQCLQPSIYPHTCHKPQAKHDEDCAFQASQGENNCDCELHRQPQAEAGATLTYMQQLIERFPLVSNDGIGIWAKRCRVACAEIDRLRRRLSLCSSTVTQDELRLQQGEHHTMVLNGLRAEIAHLETELAEVKTAYEGRLEQAAEVIYQLEHLKCDEISRLKQELADAKK